MWDSWIIALLATMECLEAGLNTLSKAAMTRGMSNFIFVAYSYILGMLFLLPSALIYFRKSTCPKLPLSIACRIFVVGLLGGTVQIMVYKGISYSSATMFSAMNGLVPAFTFILGILTRMEKLDLKAQSSRAKALGTVISIAGAYIVLFYQGPPVMFSRPFLNFQTLGVSPQSNWIIGGILLVISSFVTSVSWISMARIINDYPVELVVVVLGSSILTIFSAIVALIVERDPNAWKLRPDLELATIAYSGILMVGIRSVVHTWACRRKGPLFITMFRPLQMAFAVAMGVAFLRDTLYFGSVIGAAIIAIGFYFVMRGKAEEVRILEESTSSGLVPFPNNVPFLLDKGIAT